MKDDLIFVDTFGQMEVILDRSHINYQYSKYLNNPESALEREIIKNYEFFSDSKIAFIISTVLDLCILLDVKGNFSLNKLFGILKNSKQADIFSADIVVWEAEILAQQTTIRKLFSIRDKHYAHLDKKRGDIMLSIPTYDEFQSLFKVICQILKKIHLVVYNADMDYGVSFLGGLRSILGFIAEKIENP